jgi:hypothetical protein
MNVIAWYLVYHTRLLLSSHPREISGRVKERWPRNRKILIVFCVKKEAEPLISHRPDRLFFLRRDNRKIKRWTINQYPREYHFLGSIQKPARTSHFLEVTPIVAHYKPGIVPCRTVFFNGGARWDHDLHVMSLNHAQQKWTETRTLTHTFSIAFWLAMEISNWDASFFFLSMAEIDFGNSWLMMCRFAASFVGFLSHLSMTSRFNIKVRLYLISWFKHFVVLQLDR